MANCLLIVDVQEGFVSDTTRHVVPKIRELLSQVRFNHIVATKFMNYKDSPYERFIGWHKFMPGTAETEVCDFVVSASERIFVKNTYTALTEEFLEYINANGIDEIFVVGIDTDCCVLTTSVGLFERNISFKVLLDCCASNGGQKSHDAAVLALTRLIGTRVMIRDSTVFYGN